MEAAISGHAAKILVVEDNELNMKMFNALLGSHGYQTVQSVDGSDFLEVVEEHRPDLIVMDIYLPGWSGLDLTRPLKDIDYLKHIPVIAVSAFAMPGDEQRILDTGCEECLTKPISIPAFLSAIARHLEPSSVKRCG